MRLSATTSMVRPFGRTRKVATSAASGSLLRTLMRCGRITQDRKSDGGRLMDNDIDGNNGRQELLLKMYDQLFNDINTHIIVVWQSVGVLVGAFAVLALVEKNIISVDIGTTLILLVCGWLFANLLDSAYWY